MESNLASNLVMRVLLRECCFLAVDVAGVSQQWTNSEDSEMLPSKTNPCSLFLLHTIISLSAPPWCYDVTETLPSAVKYGLDLASPELWAKWSFLLIKRSTSEVLLEQHKQTKTCRMYFNGCGRETIVSVKTKQYNLTLTGELHFSVPLHCHVFMTMER